MPIGSTLLTQIVRPDKGLHRPTYDDEWIQRGLSKHKANYSMVICFETSDPERLEQLKNLFCTSPPEEYKNHSIYIYDPWNGLGRLNKETKQVSAEIPQEEGRFREELGKRIRELERCLNVMDTKLKEEETIFILHGLTQEQKEEKERLVSALKAWAISKDLIYSHSLVILLVSAPSGLLDEETKDLIATVEVEMGKNSEYEELIVYLSKLFGLLLRKEEKGTLEKAIRGLNLHQAEAILRESYALKHRFDLEQLKISKGELVKKTGILEIEEPKEGFEGIGGYQAVKEFIQRKIIDAIHKPEEFKRFVIPLPRGILFFGPPGTGKTLFAKALAKAIKLPFINLKTENIYSMWLGESGQKMKSAIRTAEQMSPAIVFIDEIDRFGKRTGPQDTGGETRRVFSQLLEWLGDENRKAIIIGTTNKPEDLDKAFIRTGRFDYKIPLLYPDAEARLAILRIHLGLPNAQGKPSPKLKPPLELPDKEVVVFLKKEVVPRTENYTGAELEELATRTKRNARERGAKAIGPEDFRKSLHSFRIDPESRKRDQQKYENLTRIYTDDETFLKDLALE